MIIVRFQRTPKYKTMKKIITIITILLLIPVITQAQSKQVIHKKIALTFDADMTSGMLARLESGADKSLLNQEIVDILRREKVPATIFLSGLWAEKYQQTVKDLSSDSLFELGNHSYSHRSFTASCYTLPNLPSKLKEADIAQAQKTIFNLTGKTPNLFRFPGGCHAANDLVLLNRLNLQVVGWTLASGDAFNNDAKTIIKNVIKNAKDGSMVVFHLSGGRYAPKTAEALKTIIPELRKMGYEFVTVSSLKQTPKK